MKRQVVFSVWVAATIMVLLADGVSAATPEEVKAAILEATKGSPAIDSAVAEKQRGVNTHANECRADRRTLDKAKGAFEAACRKGSSGLSAQTGGAKSVTNCENFLQKCNEDPNADIEMVRDFIKVKESLSASALETDLDDDDSSPCAFATVEQNEKKEKAIEAKIEDLEKDIAKIPQERNTKVSECQDNQTKLQEKITKIEKEIVKIQTKAGNDAKAAYNKSKELQTKQNAEIQKAEREKVKIQNEKDSLATKQQTQLEALETSTVADCKANILKAITASQAAAAAQKKYAQGQSGMMNSAATLRTALKNALAEEQTQCYTKYAQARKSVIALVSHTETDLLSQITGATQEIATLRQSLLDSTQQISDEITNIQKEGEADTSDLNNQRTLANNELTKNNETCQAALTEIANRGKNLETKLSSYSSQKANLRNVAPMTDALEKYYEYKGLDSALEANCPEYYPAKSRDKSAASSGSVEGQK